MHPNRIRPCLALLLLLSIWSGVAEAEEPYDRRGLNAWMGAVVGQQPFGGGRSSGTNDKAGSIPNMIRWTTPRTIKDGRLSALPYGEPVQTWPNSSLERESRFLLSIMLYSKGIWPR